MAFSVPMGYNSASDTVRIPGYVPPIGQPETPIVPDNFVSPDYFQNLHIPILRGRQFTDADDSAAPGVVIVNEAMEQTFWPHEDPIGKELTFGDGPPRKARVVGVVRNSRYDSIAGPIGPYFYAPIAQVFSYPETLQVRTFSADPTPMIREITGAVQALDPQMPIFGAETMRQALDTKNGLLVYQFGAAIAAALGLLGLILAVVGVYGVVSYSTSQRVQEISIRMALGAQSSSILRLMLRQGLNVILIGIAAGMIAGFAMARMAGGFLVNVGPGDPLTYAVVSTTVLLAALLACYIPSRRAMRVDPIVALRNE
jgi:putative ABC transport system permease protein